MSILDGLRALFPVSFRRPPNSHYLDIDNSTGRECSVGLSVTKCSFLEITYNSFYKSLARISHMTPPNHEGAINIPMCLKVRQTEIV